MSRLPSRQIFKALRSHLRYPLRLSSRHVHTSTMQVPYTGAPTYDTIARRFSSNPSPLAFYIRKKQQEARNRGEFIDIHDIGRVDPEDYDVLITDVDGEKLRSEIADIIGIQYLVEATEADADKVVEIGHAIVYGPKYRTIFPCVVSRNGKAHWVFFVVDTGAPLTYISAQAWEVLGIETDEDPTYVKIAGYTHLCSVSPKNAHFSEISILGADFCNTHKLSLCYSGHKKMDLYLGGRWMEMMKPKL